jgi:hypothetical protein
MLALLCDDTACRSAQSGRCRRSATPSVGRQNVSLSKLLLNRLNAFGPMPPVLSNVVSAQSPPSAVGHRHYSNRKAVLRMVIECLQLLVENPYQVSARNFGFGRAFDPPRGKS